MEPLARLVCLDCRQYHPTVAALASLLAILCSVAASGGAIHRQQFTIPEEQPIGTVVGRIGPTDDATTSDQNQHLPRPPYFIYFRSGNTDPAARHFIISGENGTIAIRSPIDRESMSTTSSSSSSLSAVGETDFRFEFVAESRDGHTIAVVVYVVDINDNAPLFPVPVVRLTIPESVSPESARFTLHRAADLDAGTNGVLRYRIISGNDDRKFKLVASTSSGQEVPASGARLELGLESALDFESRAAYRLLIEALDGGQPTPKSGQLEVIIDVLDVNDNSPQFDVDRFVVSVPEDAAAGTRVIRISATDRDSSDNGRLRYRIERVRSAAAAAGAPMAVVDAGRNHSQISEDGYKELAMTTMMTTAGSVQSLNHLQIESTTPFEIDSTSGWLTTRIELDYETTVSYELIVVAEDGGHRSLQTSAVVFVQVLDVNDNAPSIAILFLSDDKSSSSTSSGTRLSKSRSKPGDVVARVSVTDRDSGSVRQLTVVLACQQPVSSVDNATFTLVKQVGRGAKGEVGLDVDDVSIDYLLVVGTAELTAPWYRFVVTATDVGSLSDSRLIDIFIDDDDVDDISWPTSPTIGSSFLRFSQSSYRATIDPRSTRSGDVIARVRLADAPVPRPRVLYSLAEQFQSDVEDDDDRPMVSDDRGLFRIGRRSGVVRTSGRIACGVLPPVVKLVVLVVEDDVVNGSSSTSRPVVEEVSVSQVQRVGRRRSAATALDVFVEESRLAPGEANSDGRDVIGRLKFERDFYEIDIAENEAIGRCFLTVGGACIVESSMPFLANI